MLKKSVTFTDFNGEPRTEDVYFHLSKAELIEMEMSKEGGMAEFLKGIAASNDGKQIISEMKKLVLGAYGKKSDDGTRFLKNQSLRDDFESSEAYSTLFFELCTNTGAAADFVNGIVPAGLDVEMARVTQAENPDPKEVMGLTGKERMHRESRAHPSDVAAKHLMEDPKTVIEEHRVPDPRVDTARIDETSREFLERTGGTPRNVFETGRVGDPDIPEARGPQVLTYAEAKDLDPDELRSGLATGRYTLS